MELIRSIWKKEDIAEFQEYIKTFSDPTRVEWQKKLLKTELPVMFITTKDIKNIVNNIAKGNFISFLDLMISDYYENTAINGYLICKIKNFDTLKHYLDIYSSKADNWSTCDILSFNVKGKEEKFLNLILEYIKSDKPFVRRIGIRILFKFVNDTYIDKIFEILDTFEYEENYYVNMINAWLLCECFIKQRDKTLKYLSKNKLNAFTINKGIQKCRESYRVSSEDKELLLKYKIK